MSSRIDAEVAGGLGPGTQYDPSLPQPLVGTLRYEFQGWLGDELVTTSGYWIVTEELASSLAASDLTGYELADVIVTKDEQYDLMPHAHELPTWRRLIPTGTPDVDDFGLEGRTGLIVSDAALDLLRTHRLDHAELSPADRPAPVSPIMQRFLAMREARSDD